MRTPQSKSIAITKRHRVSTRSLTAVSALRFGTAVHDLADLWVRLVFSQSLSLSLTSLRLGVSRESQRGETETETEHLVLAKLLECGVKHRFGLDGRMALLPPKAVSALRFGTAVQDLAELRGAPGVFSESQSQSHIAETGSLKGVSTR